ncbi:hypothetical protein [Streptomyces rubradiris]|nr:hypothetical protein [Streptomyces rubradiris]
MTPGSAPTASSTTPPRPPSARPRPQGRSRPGLRARTPRTGEIPFDPAAKYMVTFHPGCDESVLVHAKGAVDVLMDRCTHLLTDQGPVPSQRSAAARSPTSRGAWAARVCVSSAPPPP